MKSVKTYTPGTRFQAETCKFRPGLMLLLVATFLCSVATGAEAANITFEPSPIVVTAAPGDTVSVPVTVSLSDTYLGYSYANFSLAHVDGTFDHTWLINPPYIFLNNWYYKSRQVILQLSPPLDVQGGRYSGVLRTVWLRSNESIVPADLMIDVIVDQQNSCNQVPIFSNIVSAAQAIDARNNKATTIALSGAVEVPEGCETHNLWYELTDEYGELDHQETVRLNDDGSFSVSVPVVASRHGNDKDGRQYSVKFKAENEAGVSESGVANIVITHDNRKK